MFSERAPQGTELRVYVQPSPEFRPADDATDILLIGPGTGIAPFRAFLQERALRKASGRSWLFFGARTEASDFLYGDELRAWADDGTLTHLSTAFSRDQDHKIYVQHRMEEHAAELWAWIEGGAQIFVCGDAEFMAPDVHQALVGIVSTQGSMSEEEASAYLTQAMRDHRDLRDVY